MTPKGPTGGYEGLDDVVGFDVARKLVYPGEREAANAPWVCPQPSIWSKDGLEHAAVTVQQQDSPSEDIAPSFQFRAYGDTAVAFPEVATTKRSTVVPLSNTWEEIM
jgi:hypothetical protein